MLISLFLCHILFIPLTTSSSTTKHPNDSPSLSKITNSSDIEQGALKTTNYTVISEGGTTVQSSPVSLVDQNHTLLLSLDNVLEKDKSLQPSNSKIVPRKGAVYPADNGTHVQGKSQLDTHEGETKTVSPLLKEITAPNVAPLGDMNVHKAFVKPSIKEDILIVTTPRPKKPLILSKEAIDRMDIYSSDSKVSSLNSSEKSHVDATIPINNDVPAKKMQPVTASRHPGMVMPIVITVLVVPMFAVLGYMALKRGQEAWKNRHYKRMDFLLDGMYNE